MMTWASTKITWVFNIYPSNTITFNLRNQLIGDRIKNVVKNLKTNLTHKQLARIRTVINTVAFKVNVQIELIVIVKSVLSLMLYKKKAS